MRLGGVAVLVAALAVAAGCGEREEPSGLQKVLGSSVFRSFARSAASAAGREISRSLFGTAPRRRARTRTRW